MPNITAFAARAIGLALSMLPAAAFAQTDDQAPGPPPLTTIDTQRQPARSGRMLGSLGGLRDRLDDAGIDVAIGYVSEFGANVSGGARHAATESGQFSFDTTIDTEKALGWKGGTIHSSISYRRGDNLVTHGGLDTLLQPQEVYGRGQTWHLSEFWLRQRSGSFDLELGRLTMGGDFASQPCEFMNLTFCGDQQGNLVGDYWYNYPLSQWGGRLKVAPGQVYAMIGIYEYNPNNMRKGIALSHGGAQGVTAPLELGWTPRLGSDGLPGRYRVGGWYSTATANDVLDDRDGHPFGLSGLDPARRSGRYGGYVLLQQQLTGTYVMGADGPKTTRGLNIFVNFTQTDRRTSRLDNQEAVWLTFTGPLRTRPDDELGFAVGRNAVNGRAADAIAIASPGSEKPGAEYPMELFYAAHLASWLTASPNVQYIVSPGGYSQARDIVVLGVKSGVTF